MICSQILKAIFIGTIMACWIAYDIHQRSNMRIIYLSILCILLFTLPSCQYFKSEHPQAALEEEGSTGITDKSILSFAAATDRNISYFKKQFSLIYMSGDLSMYAEKYNGHSNGTLYKTYSDNGHISTTVKSYYLRNDSLVLVVERNKTLNDHNEIFKDVRAYLRNNIIFKMDSRTASSSAALVNLPYLLVQRTDNKYPDENYLDEVKGINDAIQGKDKFEMVFDNITTYPEAHYIILKSKNRSNYKASLLVNAKDGFIDSLLNYPALFKDQKLNFIWSIKDKEAVYVPVADTSASGLKR